MRPAELHPYRSGSPFGWAWDRLKNRIWALEHAFERNKAANRAVDDTRLRILLVTAVFGTGFAALAVGATKAALFSSAEVQGPVVAQSSARAELTDRNGRLLALDLMHYGVYLDPREVWDAPETRRGLMSVLPRLSERRLERALKGDRRVHLIGGLTPQERAKVHALGFAGVSFEPEQRRVYPLGATAAHLIGFSDRGGQGLAGAERAFNEPLRANGVDGAPVALSIDLRVQAALEDELTFAAIDQQVKGAVGLVADVQTGEILALASYPEFDPGAPGDAPPEALLNRAAASVYEMGSTFKGFTIAIGLDSGRVTRADTFDATQPLRMAGRTVRDFHATNRVLSLEEVFTKSSNIGTSRIALAIGPEIFSSYLKSWGLLDAAPVELAESARPIRPAKWNENTLASASFGHAVSVTPLMLTRAMLPVLNGGYQVPLTVRRLPAHYQPPRRRVLKESTSQAMLELMRANVLTGSGKSADIKGLRVGGKTGTGEKVVDGRYSSELNISSFAAVFPSDGAPRTKRYFVLILMDEPKGGTTTGFGRTGGGAAAPPAGKVINRIAPFLGVARVAEPPPAPLLVSATPAIAAPAPDAPAPAAPVEAPR